MPGYHFYCLNAEGRFGFGKHIEAEDLNAAIRWASQECRAHPAGPFSGLRGLAERTTPLHQRKLYAPAGPSQLGSDDCDDDHDGIGRIDQSAPSAPATLGLQLPVTLLLSLWLLRLSIPANPLEVGDRLAESSERVNPSSRIGGVFSFAPVADQRVSRKGLHYTRCLGTVWEAIRGGGWGGKLSLSCWIRSLSSGSG